MKTNQASTDRSHPNQCRYALRRVGAAGEVPLALTLGARTINLAKEQTPHPGPLPFGRGEGEPSAASGHRSGSWEVTFEGREAIFKQELGALHVACLLLEPPRKAIHGVALALNAKEKLGQTAGPAEVLEQREMGLEDASAVRALWRRQRELERVLEDRLEIEPVKLEAQRELEEIVEHLRQSPWLTRQGAERCAQAVAVAIQRLQAHLAGAVDAEGRPDEVLRAFALHLQVHLLAPSGRGGSYDRAQAWAPSGCFIYVPPRNVVWNEGQGVSSAGRHPAAVDYLSRFLCAGFALALLMAGCASRPLKGGKAVTTHKPAGVIEQTLLQGENPSQATKQDQESVKVRTYTVPAGSRLESRASCG